MLNITRYQVLSQGYVRNQDVQKIIPCKRSTATTILADARKFEDGSYVPYSQAVSSKAIMRLFGWTEEQIYENAKKEAEIRAITHQAANCSGVGNKEIKNNCDYEYFTKIRSSE